MRFSRCLIRSAPATLPLFLVIAATAGIASWGDFPPSYDNLLFAIFMNLVPGYLQLFFGIGLVMLIIDLTVRSAWPILLILYLWFVATVAVLGFYYGTCMDF